MYKAPDKICFDRKTSQITQIWHDKPTINEAADNIEYISKDVVEKIIRGSLGPQDALNKIHKI